MFLNICPLLCYFTVIVLVLLLLLLLLLVAVLLHMIHLFEVPSEVTGDDIIAIWVGRQDVTNKHW